MRFFIGAGIVLTCGDKYVLIKEVRHKKAGHYNLPAGTLEVGEDLLQCIRREASEETGADITLEHFLGVYQTVISSGSNVVFLVFSGSVPEDVVFYSEEHEVIKTLTYDEIVELDYAGKLRSPVVLKSIQDHRNGKFLPLESIQSWRVDTLTSITVEKDH